MQFSQIYTDGTCELLSRNGPTSRWLLLQKLQCFAGGLLPFGGIRSPFVVTWGDYQSILRSFSHL